MSKQNYTKKSKTALALIELLVAISIFAAVATVVYSTLFTGTNAYQRAQKELELNQETNQILDRLSTELRNCYGADYNNETEKGGFIGEPNKISFFTIQNIYSKDTSKKVLARVGYNFKDNKLFKKLQLDKDTFLDESQFQEEELLSDIKNFNLEYLYLKRASETEYEWKSAWEDKSLVPKGVRVELARHDAQTNTDVSLKRYILLMQGEIPPPKQD
jgi:type II secretion system protein J